jgi:SAM-dependent methyltransferase
LNEDTRFCKKIVQGAEEFLRIVTLPDYQSNARQYTDPAHVVSLFKSFQVCNSLVKEYPTALDIGTGINFYKQINTNITTSNPSQRGIGVKEMYEFINQRINAPVDISLLDINTHDQWIQTEQKFHAVVAHRFLPWAHKPFTVDVYKRFIRECHRVLQPDGVLFYYSNHIDIFFQRAGKERYIWDEAIPPRFFKTSKQRLSEILK